MPKEGSIEFHEKEEYQLNNDIDKYSRASVVIYANIKLLEDEISLSYIIDTGQAILTSNAGRSLAYLNVEFEQFLEDPYNYFKLKATTISIGFVNLYAIRTLSSHAVTTISILPFMDNISDDMLSLLISPIISSYVTAVIGGINIYILNRDDFTGEQIIQNTMNITITSCGSMIYRWFSIKIMPLIKNPQLMDNMNTYLIANIKELENQYRIMYSTGTSTICTDLSKKKVNGYFHKLTLKTKILAAKMSKSSLPILKILKPLLIKIGLLSPTILPIWLGSVITVFCLNLLNRLYNSQSLSHNIIIPPRFKLLQYNNISRSKLLQYNNISRSKLLQNNNMNTIPICIDENINKIFENLENKDLIKEDFFPDLQFDLKIF